MSARRWEDVLLRWRKATWGSDTAFRVSYILKQPIRWFSDELIMVTKLLVVSHCLSWVEPWPVWLSGLGIIPQSKRPPVRFPVRAHAWVAGLEPGRDICERQPSAVSLPHRCFSPSLSLPSPLSKNEFKKASKKWSKAKCKEKEECKKTEQSIQELQGGIECSSTPVTIPEGAGRWSNRQKHLKN